jgi:D-erythro-7,8-dihydroneopterin triphosphate epimerase
VDRIIITDLETRCIVGINEDERRAKQDVTLNLTLFADLRTAGTSDRFEDTLDYRALKKLILDLVENSHYFLLEALAEAVACLCLTAPRARKVLVRVDKPSALRFARSVAVEIEREREM